LPAGAQAVPLAVGRIPDRVLADVTYGVCPMALLGPFVTEYEPGASPPIVHRAGDQRFDIVWQPGFSARLNPKLEIVAPNGRVVVRESQQSIGFGGGVGDDGKFHVCLPEYGPRRADGSR
jgi:hypothetical protein